MVVCDTKQVSADCIKITSDTGLAFFIRKSYLKITDINDIVIGAELINEYEKDVVDAGFIFTAEKKAIDYLARAEHSRFNLTKKLKNKGFDDYSINNALDYLESVNYLSDERFARAWLSARKISHCEGKAKLQIELCKRGINKDISSKVLEEFFLENDESSLCQKAYQKCVKLKMTEEKIIRRLMGYGFSYKVIKKVINFNTEEII